MHYRVESKALPRVRTFKKYEKAVAFAEELRKQTDLEICVRIVGASEGRSNRVVFCSYILGRDDSPSPE
jgi:hypothetical protein